VNFWKNIFKYEKEPSKGELLHFKILELFVIGFVIHFAWDWGFYIQQIGEVVLPLGIAQYIDVSFMFDNGISLINAALMTLFALLGFFRILPRYSYLITFVLFHLHYVSRYSLGEISHGSNFIGMSVLALALGLFFFREAKMYRRFVFGFLFFFIGLGYTSAAISKLVASGILWPSGEHLWLWIAERRVDVLSAGGAFSLNWIQELVVEHKWFATLTLAFGLLSELFGFTLWFDKTRPYIAVALIAMHIGIDLTMNILFDMYIYELLILGFPWGYWLNKYLSADNAVLQSSYRLSAKFA